MASKVRVVVCSKLVMRIENPTFEDDAEAQRPKEDGAYPQMACGTEFSHPANDPTTELGPQAPEEQAPPPYEAHYGDRKVPEPGVSVFTNESNVERFVVFEGNVPGVNNDAQHAEERVQDEDGWPPRHWAQYIAAFLASLSCLSIGYVDGWSAFAVPFFKSVPGKDVYMDNETSPEAFTDLIIGSTPIRGLSNDAASWLCSLVAVGGMLGAIPAGYLADTLGRKGTLIFMTIPCVISWGTVVFSSDSLIALYCSRIMAGFMMGVVSIVVPMYAEEISEVRARGAVCLYQDMMQTLGLLIAYVLGYLLPFPLTASLPCIFPMILLIFFPAMPESPLFLLRKGLIEDAKAAFRFLRGPWINADALVCGLLCSELTRREFRFQVPALSPKDLIVYLWKHISFYPKNRGIRIAFMLMLHRQFSGINAVAFYAVEIFTDAKTGLSAQQCAILVAVVEVAATMLASVAVDKVGRRPLLIMSSLGMTVAHLGMAIYLTYLNEGNVPDNWGWTPVVLISMFVVSYSLGFGPLPWLMMAELIPPTSKRWATSLTGLINWGSMFLILQGFSMFSGQVGIQYAFLFFSVCSVVGGLAVFVVVPETKGKCAAEIQRILKLNKFAIPLRG